jgi:hypothetical protein
MCISIPHKDCAYLSMIKKLARCACTVHNARMNQKAIAAVNRLTEHVEQQKKARDTDKDRVATKAEIGAREIIMDEIVEALGLTPKLIQDRLVINRTTWERWRRMDSIPNQSQLDRLRRLVEDDESSSVPRRQTLTSPLEFLNATPCTYAQLRVLFSHEAFHWNDAIFHFRKPFYDPIHVIDMASLALNGCRQIYMLKSSLLAENSKDHWAQELVTNMVKGLGRQVAAQALANFCLVEISEEEDKNIKEFGVLNFKYATENTSVGYFWFGNDNFDSKNSIFKADAYMAKRANDESFEPLRLQYGKTLDQAFKIINDNTPSNVGKEYDDEAKKYPLEIPKIINKTNEPKNVIVYV